jgi:hypothetical protein
MTSPYGIEIKTHWGECWEMPEAHWPAPGSEDTELGVFMELEVRHGEAAVYPRIQARGCASDQGSGCVVCAGIRRSGRASDPATALGEGVCGRSAACVPWCGADEAGEQLEITRLKREVIKLKAERDILKKAAAYFAKEST